MGLQRASCQPLRIEWAAFLGNFRQCLGDDLVGILPDHRALETARGAQFFLSQLDRLAGARSLS